MENQQVYKFKKDDPNYKTNRHKHLIALTKQKYKTDEDFRNKMKNTSRDYYYKLKELAYKNI